jgi:hypothetical protein
LVAVYLVYSNMSGSGSSPQPAPKGGALTERNRAADLPQMDGTPASAPSAGSSTAQTPSRRPASPRGDEFRPVWRSKRPEDRIDPHQIDPTLRTDLLAKVQEIKPEGGMRNLFQFGAAPPKELKGAEQIVAVAPKKFDFPRPLPPPIEPGPPPPPPPEPPIGVKYYGIATKRINGRKTAFFLDGDNILLAPEGGIVKTKYRVVRINVSSVVVENTENKKQQTLQISEDAGAGLSY